jgi:hypothetical protein
MTKTAFRLPQYQTILAGLLSRNTSSSADDLASSAIEAADKLRAAPEDSPKLAAPVGFTSQGQNEPPPGTPEKTKTGGRVNDEEH